MAFIVILAVLFAMPQGLFGKGEGRAGVSVFSLLDRFRRLRRHRLISLVPLAAIILVLPLLFPSAYYYRVAAMVLIFAIASLASTC